MTTETKVDKTLREVIGDSVNSQTQKKSEDTNSQQTQSGEKREFVSGIDVSDIPDNMTKAEFKDFLAKKGKLLEDGYVPKFKQVAEYAKERDTLLAQGVSIADATRIIRESITNKANENKGDVKKEIKREIDQLKDEAPDLDTRKGIERLERIINEQSTNSPAYKELKERLDKAEKALGYVNHRELTNRTDGLNKALDELSDNTYDKEFIDKYRDAIIEEGKKYPDAPVKKIISVITDPDELHAAILKTKKKESSENNRLKEKINANDSASSGVTGSDKQIDVKTTGLKRIISHVMSQKR